MREAFNLGGKRRYVLRIEDAHLLVQERWGEVRREGSVGCWHWEKPDGTIVAEAWVRRGPGWWLVIKGS